VQSGKLGLRLLGPPEAYRDGEPLSFRTRKAFALLCYLAAEGGTHRREKLATLLWPESEEKKARTTLRSVLADVRGVLGAGGATDDEHLLIARDSLGFRAEAGADLDLTVLRSAYGLARDSAGIARPDGKQRRELLGQLRKGSEAYRGGFLEGFYLDDAPEFDHWAGLEREGWRRRAEAIFDRLSELELAAGEVGEAIATAERWTHYAPTSEAAHLRLMEAHFAAGDGAAALRAFEACRRALGEGLGVEPSPETEALASRIRAQASPRSSPRNARSLAPGTAGSARGRLEVPFVGRSEEFGGLVAEYLSAREGGARAVAVSGEAGIGKTRLVEKFLRWAVAEGADVLRGAAFEATGGLPYGPPVGVLRERIDRERAPDDLLDDVWLSELSRLLPELRERYPDLPPPASDEATVKARLFEAVAAFVVAVASRRPVVLFVDDLHWADAATLDLLRYAAKRLAEERAPVLLLLAIREEEMDRVVDLWGWLSALERGMPVRRLKLGSLNGNDTLRVLLSLIGNGGERGGPARGLQEFGRRLHAETDGQPFFLLETIKALLDRGALTAKPEQVGAATEVAGYADAERALEDLLPPGVRGLVRERLSRLGPAASDLLAAGAVLGDGFEFGLARRVAGLEEREGLSALDEALGGRLLHEPWVRGGGEYGGYSFVHDKIRDVVYTDAGDARRRVFHRRTLEALEDEGAPAAELARHALAARANGAAFRHSVAAAEEALAVFAVEDARTHFGRARTLLEGEASGGETSRPGTPEERLRFYAGLARVHEFGREWGAAGQAYERMLSEAREAGEREAEWMALHRLATLGIEGNVTRPEEEDEFYRRVRRKREASGERGERRDGQRPGYAGPKDSTWSVSSALTRVEEAMRLAREMRREDLVAKSLAALGVLEGYSGRWERVLSAAEEVISLYSRMGDRAMEDAMLSLSAYGLLMTGEPGEAVSRMRDRPGLTGERGDWERRRAGVHSMAQALIETGDHEEALHVASEGLAAARSVGHAPRLMANLLALGDALRTLFRLREAGETYREMAGVIFPPEYRALVHSKLCAVAAVAGDWEEAHAEALPAARLRDEAPIQGTEALHRHLEVEALLRGGSESLAREQLQRFGEAVGENRRLRLAYLRALAVLRRWEGDGAAAIEHLQEARGLAEEIGLPGELWQIGASLGELYGELGNGAEARRSRSRAAEVVRRLAAGIRDRELRLGFLSVAPVQAVLDTD